MDDNQQVPAHPIPPSGFTEWIDKTAFHYSIDQFFGVKEPGETPPESIFSNVDVTGIAKAFQAGARTAFHFLQNAPNKQHGDSQNTPQEGAAD